MGTLTSCGRSFISLTKRDKVMHMPKCLQVSRERYGSFK